MSAFNRSVFADGVFSLVEAPETEFTMCADPSALTFTRVTVATHAIPRCATVSSGVFGIVAATSQTFSIFGQATTQIITTGDDELPFFEISNVHANRIYTNEAELDWDTDIPADCCVAWTSKATQTTYNWASGATVLNYGSRHQHYVYDNRNYTVTGLPSETTIYFLAASADPLTVPDGKVSDWYYFKTMSTVLTKTDYAGEPVRHAA